jgi:hypothetical protein
LPASPTRERFVQTSTSKEAADILWTISHPIVWLLLVSERGWTPAQYERWTGDLACAQLLSPT